MHPILVVPDSYKGSMSASFAARTIARGLRSSAPGLPLIECPLSDGGEGFLEVVMQAADGSVEWLETTDALGNLIKAPFGLLDKGKTVVVELASAAGLALLPEERDPLHATTFGVGLMIRKAFERHPFEKLILSLGGSATVDGGAGLLEALGVRFLDRFDRLIPRGGIGLSALARIDASDISPALSAEIVLAADVRSPLLGASGAAAVYGPQKGASPDVVRLLERNLAHFSKILAVDDASGMGAAGGVPLPLTAVCGARIESGFEIVARLVDLDRKIDSASIVVTGEGRLDLSSFEGKVVGRLAERCSLRKLPILAIAGCVDPLGEARLRDFGGAAFSLRRAPMDAETAMREAESLLERTAGLIALLL